MDNDRRSRQNPPGYAGQTGALLQPQAQYPVVSAADRFRQVPSLAQQQPPAAATSRAGPQGFGYAYDQGSQFVAPTIPSQYAGGEQQPQHQHQQQRASQYPQYGQGVMYGVPSAQAGGAAQSQYEPVQQYQQNRDSAIEVLSTGFGVAQPQYYGVPQQEGPTSAPAGALGAPSVPPQYPAMGYTAPAPQPAVPREPLAPAYSAPSMTDPQHPTARAAYSQPAYAEQPAGNEYDDFYNNYQTELKKTFEHTRDGRLRDAASQLVSISDWLLQFAETLGLVRDDETHYQQRLTLWEEFNTCWLTTLQKQKDMTQDMISTGQRPQPPQSLIDYEMLEEMGGRLVKNCDQLDKHGLVDYQMGVWEEEILAMITACLGLWEDVGVGSGSSQRVPQASSSRRR